MRNYFFVGIIGFAATLQAIAGPNDMLEEYRPIIPLFQAGKNAEAIAACEKIAAHNSFAADSLALIYSRGYLNTPTDYQKYCEYLQKGLDRIVADELTLTEFWDSEAYSMERNPPSGGITVITLPTWNRESRQFESRDYPLLGSYPRIRCYEEEMTFLGGGIPGEVLYLNAGNQPTRPAMFLRDAARELGNCAAILASYTYMGPNGMFMTNEQGLPPEQFAALAHSADQGHIPSMLVCAQISTRDFPDNPADYGRARAYLQNALAAFAKYREIGCRHYLEHEKFAANMLKDIPDPEWSVEKLEQQLANCPPERQGPLRKLLAEKSDAYRHFDEGMRLQRTDRKRSRELIREAALSNHPEAILTLINERDLSDPERWRWLYLGGKNQLGPYYEELHNELQSGHSDTYPIALVTLAAAYPPALELLQGQYAYAAELLANPLAGGLELENANRLMAAFDAAFRETGISAATLGLPEVRRQTEASADAPITVKNLPAGLVMSELREPDNIALHFQIEAPIAQAELEIDLPPGSVPERSALQLLHNGQLYEEVQGKAYYAGNHISELTGTAVAYHDMAPRQVRMQLRDLNPGDWFYVYIFDELWQREWPKGPDVALEHLKPTAEEAEVYTLPASESGEVEFYGIEPEFCFSSWNEEGTRLNVGFAPGEEDFDGEVIIVFPDSAQFDRSELRHDSLLQSTFPYEVKLYLTQPEQVLRLTPVNYKRIYSRLKAIGIKAQMPLGRTVNFFIEFPQE